MENPSQFQENVKNTFVKAKEHALRLETEISQIKMVLEEIKAEIKALKKAPNPEESAVPQEEFTPISTGNQGVNNNSQQSTVNNSQQQSTILQQSTTLEQLKKDIENKFKTLTDREFSVFLTLYSMDKEKGGEVSYSEISLQLNLSEATIRGYINALINKKLPIQRNRFFNSKVSLSIKNEFKQLDLYQKLLSLRANKQGQKTLFDL